jgi:hypothetical protein
MNLLRGTEFAAIFVTIGVRSKRVKGGFAALGKIGMESFTVLHTARLLPSILIP